MGARSRLPVWALLIPLVTFACKDDDDDDGTTPSDTEETDTDVPEITCNERDELRRPFFGETHAHTSLSLDANLQGIREDPTSAYAYAQGADLDLPPYIDGVAQRTINIGRPLDWVALSDHSEFLGSVQSCTDPTWELYDAPECVEYREDPDVAFVRFNIHTALAQDRVRYPSMCGDDGALCADAQVVGWQKIQEAAEAAQDRTEACSFTTFVGYEWSGGPSTRNLHRNVIFKNAHVPDWPTSYFDEPYEDGLWDALQRDCRDQPPCDVLTISHNSNLSDGIMFPELGSEEMTAEYAAARNDFEPLVEVYQHKGDSECWEGAPGNDEMCSFEKVPFNTLSGFNQGFPGIPQPSDFITPMMGEGLAIQAALGANPYQFGLIGSTDTHLAAPGAVDERGYPGHAGAGPASRDEIRPGFSDLIYASPGGLAVVWAEQNTRQSLFAAMERKEVYGTSGPRMILRVFGGEDLPEDMCDGGGFAATGYAEGVPMGGEITPAGGTFRLAIDASADPGTESMPGTPLQRLQVIKAELQADGEVAFTTLNVAGDPDNGASVDLDTCETTGEGFANLCTVWTDPDYDATRPAWYYVRAVENPSCRWSTWQCVDAGITCPTEDEDFADCCTDVVPKTIQERAWSSPIWIQPD